ncbi:hypothetical protein BDQ17DRAFT_1373577 [Cyathus striatus]|nr:hypothetical protein BDQ17DRAFT_1373577 [Cyathus striatus]
MATIRDINNGTQPNFSVLPSDRTANGINIPTTHNPSVLTKRLPFLEVQSLGLRKSIALAVTLGPLLFTLFPPRRPKPILPPVPDGVERIFIKGLVASPSKIDDSKAPILFVHGCYGSADVLAVLSHIGQKKHSLPLVIVVVDQYGAQLRKTNQISGLSRYINWMKIDPTLFLRMTYSNGYTVLNTPQRITYAHSLYGDANTQNLPDEVPDGFTEQMNKEESIIWPSQMLQPFVNAHRVF